VLVVDKYSNNFNSNSGQL